jgi:hypothetical protein
MITVCVNGINIFAEPDTIGLALVHAFQQGQIDNDAQLAEAIRQAVEAATLHERAGCVRVCNTAAEEWSGMNDWPKAQAASGLAIVLAARRSLSSRHMNGERHQAAGPHRPR